MAVVMPLVGLLYFGGRCCVWQMLLPIWLMLLPFVTCYVRQMLFARVAGGIANPGGCGSDVMTMWTKIEIKKKCTQWLFHLPHMVITSDPHPPGLAIPSATLANNICLT